MLKRLDIRSAVVAAVIAAALLGAPAVAQRIADYARDAGKVDGFNASELTRAGAAARIDHLENFHSGGFATILRKKVIAPVRGVVLAWGHFSAEWDSDSDPGSFATLAARLRIDDRAMGPSQHIEMGRSTVAGTQAIVVGGAVPVKPGAHVLTLQLKRTEGSALTHIYPRHVQTLFVPFGNDGSQGSL